MKNFLAKWRKIDWLVFFAILILLVLGISILYSLSLNTDTNNFSIFRKQIFFVLSGLALFFLVSSINYNVWLTYSKLIYIIFAGILLAVLLVFSVNAEHPWPVISGNLQHTGLSPYDTSQITGAVKWIFEMQDGTESSPTIAEDGTIYFGSHDGYNYCPDNSSQEKTQPETFIIFMCFIHINSPYRLFS